MRPMNELKTQTIPFICLFVLSLFDPLLSACFPAGFCFPSTQTPAHPSSIHGRIAVCLRATEPQGLSAALSPARPEPCQCQASTHVWSRFPFLPFSPPRLSPIQLSFHPPTKGDYLLLTGRGWYFISKSPRLAVVPTPLLSALSSFNPPRGKHDSGRLRHNGRADM